MIYMGIDIGGSTRNGITIINDKEKILYTVAIPFDKHKTKGDHRRFVAQHVLDLVIQYNVDMIVIERVKMHRGSNLSRLSNIVSLSKATATIIDKIFDKCKIYDCETVSWKSKILGNKSATKEDAVNFVKRVYGIEVPHDQADSACQAIYLKRYINDTVNGKFQEITDK